MNKPDEFDRFTAVLARSMALSPNTWYTREMRQRMLETAERIEQAVDAK